MPSYYYTKFQKNPYVGRNERCPFHFLEVKFSIYLNRRVSCKTLEQKVSFFLIFCQFFLFFVSFSV